MNSKQMSLEEFVGHRTRDYGDGTKFLKNWKKRQPPKILVALHTLVKPMACWQHNKPRIVERKDKDGNTRLEVWGGAFNCWEPERVLRSQYRRTRESDERETPPTVCPMCKLIEHVRDEVRHGRFKFTQPVFQFKGDEASETYTAAGMFGGYNVDHMTPEQASAMRSANIRLGDAWKENLLARCNYVFVVVDLDDVTSGVQVTTERTLLGDKLKVELGNRLDSLGPNEGNPFLHPVAFQWEHRPNEKRFDEKYRVLAMPKVVIGDDARVLIVAEPPDISHVVRPGNVKALRAELEAAALVKLPFDDIFGAAEQLDTERKAAEQNDDWGDDETPPARASTPANVREAKQPEPEGITCDVCDAPMAEDEFTCPKCGQRYDEQTGEPINDPPPPEPKKKPCKRSAAKPKASTRVDVKPPRDDDPFAGDDIPWAK